jgi:hypothetical protein
MTENVPLAGVGETVKSYKSVGLRTEEATLTTLGVAVASVLAVMLGERATNEAAATVGEAVMLCPAMTVGAMRALVVLTTLVETVMFF